MRRRRLLATLSALATVLGTATIFAPAPSRAETDCPALFVVAIPGTWETSMDGHTHATPGMLSFVTRGLPDSIRTNYVNYPATAFPWETGVYGRSKAEAIGNARAMIASIADSCAETKIALLGYSQGADAAGDLAAEIGTGEGVVPPDRIAAVGLMSDPRRSPTDIQIGPETPGAGAGGARPGGFGLLADRARTICAVGDLYCATATDDFVTRFAGFVAQLSDPTLTELWRYEMEAGTLITDLRNGGGIVRMLQTQFSAEANRERIAMFEEFYSSRVHTNYPSYDVGGETATKWLHNWFAGLAVCLEPSIPTEPGEPSEPTEPSERTALSESCG
ncbi:cutinase family protein [Nocardia yamanashiensis]|uniref:cutinase family protein n=1 Tax=Nocardia yamanashiensis TaxID=209247 RepID=UPI0008351C8A|nr:cutinase family protein [Nocardia yamanashiensis]